MAGLNMTIKKIESKSPIRNAGKKLPAGYDNPLISFLMLAWNTGKYINEAIEVAKVRLFHLIPMAKIGEMR